MVDSPWDILARFAKYLSNSRAFQPIAGTLLANKMCVEAKTGILICKNCFSNRCFLCKPTCVTQESSKGAYDIV